MAPYRGEYHIKVAHHAEAPKAVVDAQAAMLADASVGPRRRWSLRRHGVLLVGLVLFVAFVVVLVMAPSVGRAGAYERCVEQAQATLADVQAADPDGQAQTVQAQADELCAGYRG